jgi:GxxExxY protein
MPTLHTDPIAKKILGAAISVHQTLGPGLLEGVYQSCMAYELRERGLRADREVAVPVTYKGIRLDCGFRLDLLVEGRFIVEVKSVEQLAPIHTAQVLTYLRLSGAHQVFLFNFNAPTLKAGLKSFLGSGNLPSRHLENEGSGGPIKKNQHEDH